MPKKATPKIRKDGRYQKKVSYKGEQDFVYAKTIPELNTLATLRKAEMIQNKKKTASNYTVSEYADKWFNTYIATKEQATKDYYKQAIRLYIGPNIGKIKLDSLKKSDIVNMINVMTKNKITRKRETALATVKQILNAAVEDDVLTKNVARKVKIDKHVPTPKQSLNTKILQAYIKACEIHKHGDMYLTILYTGMRREEFVVLTASDVVLNEKHIRINKAAYFKNNRVCATKPTKNKHTRNQPILEPIHSVLEKLTLNKDPNELVFTKADGKMHTETSLRRSLESFLKEVNIQYADIQRQEKVKDKDIQTVSFTLHGIRHFYACILKKAGIDMKDASELMGHLTPKLIMEVYITLDKEDKEAAINKLNIYVGSI